MMLPTTMTGIAICKLFRIQAAAACGKAPLEHSPLLHLPASPQGVPSAKLLSRIMQSEFEDGSAQV